MGLLPPWSVSRDGFVLRERRFQLGQLGVLLLAGERDATAAIRGDALFKRRVVERAATPQDLLTPTLLCGRRREEVLCL